MCHIALEIPLPRLLYGGFIQSYNSCTTRIEMLHEARNCAAFACSITSLKDDNDLLSCFLQAKFLLLVVFTPHAIDIRISTFRPIWIETVLLKVSLLTAFFALSCKLCEQLTQNRLTIFARLPAQDVFNQILLASIGALCLVRLDVFQHILHILEARSSVNMFVIEYRFTRFVALPFDRLICLFIIGHG